MYKAKVKMELPGVRDTNGEDWAVEPRILNPGDTISNADLEKVQSDEDIQYLLSNDSLEES